MNDEPPCPITARAAELGFDTHRANVLIDDGSNLTGEVGEPVLDRSAKRAALHKVPAEAKLRVDHVDLRALLFAQGYPASAFRG